MFYKEEEKNGLQDRANKGSEKPGLLKCLLKQIFLVDLALLLFFGFLWSSSSCAELHRDSIPKGKEIKDAYLEKLFAPEFPFESIKVVIPKEDEKYMIIKAKESITDEIKNRYEKETLRKRKITITRHYHVKDKTWAFCEMTLYRVVSELPYVVEFSNIKGKQWPGNKADDVLRRVGQYLIISVGDSFASVFKKVAVYPEKENQCIDPPIVGRYPGSKSIACYEDDKIITFVIVAKAKAQDIYNYYRDKIKKHYKEVGLNFSENKWNVQDIRFPQFGMRMTTIRLSELGQLLNFMGIVMKQDVTQLYYHGPELRRLTKSSRISYEWPNPLCPNKQGR